MNPRLFRSIVSHLNASRFGTRRIDFTGLGEPLLCSNLVLFVKYAKEKGFEVGFSDNFTLMSHDIALSLVNAQLDYLFVSFDAASKERFGKIRVGACFDDVIENVKSFVETRKAVGSTKPRLVLSATIFEGNVNEVHELVKLAESLRFDAVSLFPWIDRKKTDHLGGSNNPMQLRNPQKSKIEVKTFNLRNPPGPCYAARGCYVTFDGRVLPCNCMIQIVPREQYLRYQFGDLNDNSLPDIWFSPRYRIFRARLMLGAHPSFCNYCHWTRAKAREKIKTT